MFKKNVIENREIKFRAWHKDFKRLKLIEGFRFPNKNNIDVNILNGVTIRYMKSDIVLMQYTGLKDKNGKEIYEGDIVEYQIQAGKKGNDIGQVKYYILFGFRVLNKKGKGTAGIDQIRKIIGNTYENGELATQIKN